MQQDPTIPQYREPEAHFEPASPSPRKRRESFRSILGTILILVSAPLIAIALTTYVFQSYEVDGPSMEETLQNRDRLIVLKIEQSFAKLFNKAHVPDRGDIIVFVKNGSYDSADGAEKQLIKRVIGLPGDRVVIRDGIVTLFNTAHPSGYNPDISGDYRMIEDYTSGSEVEWQIGPGEVFVLGDNRGNSLDSRAFGPISSKDIVGELKVRILPLSNIETY